MHEATHDVLWRRMRYMLSPQWDLYYSLKDLVDGKILEIGFGTGVGVVQYANDTLLVDAIEIDKGAVEFAKSVFPLDNVDWLDEDILDITPKNGRYYNWIIAVESMEHIENYHKALCNISDILLTGGKFLMTARNANADLRRNELHEREWTAAELLHNLRIYFKNVVLYDYSLKNTQGEDSRITPLIAIAEK